MRRTLADRRFLAAALGLALSGCDFGGQPEGVVVQPDASKVEKAPEPAPPATEGPSATAPEPGGWGTLTGRVTYSGDVPERKVLVEQGSKGVPAPEVCAAETIRSEELVVDPETKGVKGAIIYIPRPTAVHPEAASTARAEPVVFDQKNCVFTPHVLAAMEGNTIKVVSSDPIVHNVHSYVPRLEVNQIVPRDGSIDLPVTAAAGRPSAVTCDLHPWMKAWWLTLDNPYFAITNERGEFTLENVPSGEQKVVVWAEAVHPAFVTPTGAGEAVAIRDGQATERDFVLRPDQVRIKLR